MQRHFHIFVYVSIHTTTSKRYKQQPHQKIFLKMFTCFKRSKLCLKQFFPPPLCLAVLLSPKVFFKSYKYVYKISNIQLIESFHCVFLDLEFFSCIFTAKNIVLENYMQKLQFF